MNFLMNHDLRKKKNGEINQNEAMMMRRTIKAVWDRTGGLHLTFQMLCGVLYSRASLL
jgi:hypothetical protein